MLYAGFTKLSRPKFHIDIQIKSDLLTDTFNLLFNNDNISGNFETLKKEK